jgi:RNA polymerase sigma factor (sigma-70 family)
MVVPGSDSAPVTIRYPEDMEIAEAALEGDPEAIGAVKETLDRGAIGRWLVKRGASETEAADLLADLFTDCFGGQKAHGGLHRLLGKFNGACRLESFLRRVALNRLISLKRKQRPTISLEQGDGADDGRTPEESLRAEGSAETEDAVLELLRDSVLRAFAGADQEKFVLFRLCHSYGVSQKRISEMWGWHYSKVSRALATLGGELRDGIMAAVRETDPWLDIEWDDFLDLCGESIDLFSYTE